MAKLTTTQRKKIPSKKFALPKERKYPVEDVAHAKNAKARAQQQYDKGNLSKSELTKIDRAANKVLNKSGAKKVVKAGAAKGAKPVVKKSAPKKVSKKK